MKPLARASSSSSFRRGSVRASPRLASGAACTNPAARAAVATTAPNAAQVGSAKLTWPTTPSPKKVVLRGPGLVDELIDQDQIARGQPLAQRAHRRDRQHPLGAQLLERVTFAR